jgi:hypothetical protein
MSCLLWGFSSIIDGDSNNNMIDDNNNMIDDDYNNNMINVYVTWPLTTNNSSDNNASFKINILIVACRYS